MSMTLKIVTNLGDIEATDCCNNAARVFTIGLDQTSSNHLRTLTYKCNYCCKHQGNILE